MDISLACLASLAILQVYVIRILQESLASCKEADISLACLAKNSEVSSILARKRALKSCKILQDGFPWGSYELLANMQLYSFCTNFLY